MQTLGYRKGTIQHGRAEVRPWDVLDQTVLDLRLVVKREDFVPPQ